jgi:hypothetical protein
MEIRPYRRSSGHGIAAVAGLLTPLLLATPASTKAEEQPTPTEENRPGVGPVNIRDRTTRSLEAACVAEKGAASGWCSAYLMGVADTLTAFGNGGHKGGICEVDYSIEQLSEIFLIWTKANKSLLHLDMLAGASIAFRQTWPCR